MRLSFQNRSHRSRVGLDLATRECRQARPRKAEILGSHHSLTHLAILVELGHSGCCGRAYFIEPVFTADDPRSGHAEPAQSLRDERPERVFVDPNELMGRMGRIRQGTKDIEYRARAQIAPCDGRVPQGRMVGLREQECDARLAKDIALPLGWDIQRNAHRFEDVGAPTPARSRPVAVLGDGYSASRDYDGRRA